MKTKLFALLLSIILWQITALIVTSSIDILSKVFAGFLTFLFPLLFMVASQLIKEIESK